MTGHDFRLLGCGCLAWAAVAATLRLGGGWMFFVGIGVLSLSGVALTRRRRGPAASVLGLGCALTFMLSVTSAAHEFRSDAGPVRAWANDGAVVTARVVVTREPIRIGARKDGRPPQVLVAGRVQMADARGVRASLDAPVIVLGGAEWERVHWHDSFLVVGKLVPVERGEQARALIVARSGPREVTRPGQPLEWFESLRASLRASFARVPADPRGLSPALVDGDVSALPEDLKVAMNDVGMSHLNAVSGSNVTIVLIAALWCSGWARMKRRGRLVTALMTLAGFVLLCHPEPSVIRAAAMGAVGVLGTTAGRARAACPALGAAIVGLLAWDPWLSVSVGFALSALATLGLVLFARPWTRMVASRLPGWCAKPCELTMIPVAACVPCLPVLVALNSSVALVSIPANVVAEPLVAPATLGGMAILLLGFLPLGVRQVFAWPVAVPAWGIACIARWARTVPGGTVPWPQGVPGVLLMVAVIGVGLFAWRLLRFARWWGLVVGVVILAFPLSWRSPLPGHSDVPRAWRYALCDVGQGDGGILRTDEPGHGVAVDVGPKDTDGMRRCLERHGITTLDAVVLSHFHADHVGALPRILADIRVGDVFVTPVREEASGGGHGERGAAPEVDEALRRIGKRAVPLSPGQRLTIGGVTIDVLWPRRVIHEGSVQNNASLILDVTADDAHLLFLGDAEKEADVAVQADVQRRAEARQYDVVKVGHHGSSNQAKSLYSTLKARYGAIGVGAENDYGHPARKLLTMLEGAGTTVCRTDQNGDVTFANDGTGLVPRAQRGAC